MNSIGTIMCLQNRFDIALLLLIFLPTTVSTPMYVIAAPSSSYSRIDTFTYLAVWIVGNGILSSSALHP